MNTTRFFRVARATAIGVVFALVPGCAHYEYNIVSPPELRQHIGEKTVIVQMPPAEYHFTTFDNHLVLEIHNRQADTLKLLGDQSYVVDPRGESHPLRSQGIGPNAYIRVILPPVPPTYRAGPSIGLGFGFGTAFGGPGPRYFGGEDIWWWDEPRYFTAYDPSGEVYWPWDDDSDVRLTLAFQLGNEKPVSQSFVFHRQKM